MLRTSVRFAIILLTLETLPNSVNAQATNKELANSLLTANSLTFSLSTGTIDIANTTADAKVLSASSSSSGMVFDTGTFLFNGSASAKALDSNASGLLVIGGMNGGLPTNTQARPIPAGPMFYIIVQGAGQGISVRSMACTGNETVLSAASSLADPSIFIKKGWIARPAAKKGDKSNILTVDWEAISKQGENVTNYKLQPGDRLVFSAAPTPQAKTLGLTMAENNQGGNKPNGIEGSTPKSDGKTSSHELAMQPLPTYRIEPPDIIEIEMLKVIPLPPYRAAVFDVLQVHAQNPLPDQPLDGYFMVEGEGILTLGPSYGTVQVAGMTLDEIKVAIEKSLTNLLRNPGVAVSCARVASVQPVGGQYLVGPDGSVNMRSYGRVIVSGLTVAEAQAAIKKQLSHYLTAPEPTVDVVAFNSQVYYVIVQDSVKGDVVHRFPITGKETVLDAIGRLRKLPPHSSKNIWISRPSAADPKKGERLQIDWDAITTAGAFATNYQIYPGDRVYIAEDPLKVAERSTREKAKRKSATKAAAN